MQRKSLKQKMIEKLYEEHGIFLDPCDLVSYRRNGFGSEIVSWSTIKSRPTYQSFNTMRDCFKYPTKLVQRGLPPHVEPEITIEIDFEKIAHLTHAALDGGTDTAKSDNSVSENNPTKAAGSQPPQVS